MKYLLCKVCRATIEVFVLFVIFVGGLWPDYLSGQGYNFVSVNTDFDPKWELVQVNGIKSDQLIISSVITNNRGTIFIGAFSNILFKCYPNSSSYCREYLLFRSTDNGKTWQDITTTELRYAYNNYAEIGENAYTYLLRYGYKYGDIAIEIGKELLENHLATVNSPALGYSNGYLYIANNDPSQYLDIVKIFRSKDNGESWETVSYSAPYKSLGVYGVIEYMTVSRAYTGMSSSDKSYMFLMHQNKMVNPPSEISYFIIRNNGEHIIAPISKSRPTVRYKYLDDNLKLTNVSQTFWSNVARVFYRNGSGSIFTIPNVSGTNLVPYFSNDNAHTFYPLNPIPIERDGSKYFNAYDISAIIDNGLILEKVYLSATPSKLYFSKDFKSWMNVLMPNAYLHSMDDGLKNNLMIEIGGNKVLYGTKAGLYLGDFNY